MDEVLWPDLPEPYNGALRAAVAYVLDRYKPVGVIAAGSVLRGAPHRSSDIDLYVIHLEPFRQRVQKFFHGVPTEIFINPPHQVERYLESEQADGRPITAHMLTTGIALLMTDPSVDHLRRRGAELLEQQPVYSAPSLTMERYLAACLYEDALDVVERDPAMSNLLLERAVFAMIEYLYRREGRFLPRVKETLALLVSVDSEAAQLAHQFHTGTSLNERLPLAAAIARRTLAVEGFFEWESEPQEVVS
jgi:predicted nucleotidyltransferase